MRYRIVELNNGKFIVQTTENPHENAQWDFWEKFDSESDARIAINTEIKENYGRKVYRIIEIIEDENVHS